LLLISCQSWVKKSKSKRGLPLPFGPVDSLVGQILNFHDIRAVANLEFYIFPGGVLESHVSE